METRPHPICGATSCRPVVAWAGWLPATWSGWAIPRNVPTLAPTATHRMHPRMTSKIAGQASPPPQQQERTIH